jgi:predicted transposase YdaD
MLVEEYNVDTAVRVAKEEGWEDGREEGNLRVLDLLAQGYSVDQIKQQLGLSAMPLTG